MAPFATRRRSVKHLNDREYKEHYTFTEFDKNSELSTHIVVARFNENIAWLDAILLSAPNTTCTVYNKGKPLQQNDLYDLVSIPNIGREAETYLRYIVVNYHQLKDITIFLQGNPFDHMVKDADIASFITNRKTGPVLCDTILHERIPPYGLRTSVINALAALDQQLTDKCVVSIGAQYAIAKKDIQSRSLEFYESLLLKITNNTIDAWGLERIWGNIFFKKCHN